MATPHNFFGELYNYVPYVQFMGAFNFGYVLTSFEQAATKLFFSSMIEETITNKFDDINSKISAVSTSIETMGIIHYGNGGNNKQQLKDLKAQYENFKPVADKERLASGTRAKLSLEQNRYSQIMFLYVGFYCIYTLLAATFCKQHPGAIPSFAYGISNILFVAGFLFLCWKERKNKQAELKGKSLVAAYVKMTTAAFMVALIPNIAGLVLWLLEVKWEWLHCPHGFFVNFSTICALILPILSFIFYILFLRLSRYPRVKKELEDDISKLKEHADKLYKECERMNIAYDIYLKSSGFGGPPAQ